MARSLALVVLIALLLIGADALADRTVRLASKGSAVVRIEAGWFTMGSTPEQVEQAVQLCRDAAVGGPSCVPQSFEHETPAHRVQLASYRIDRLEVSNRAYGRCVSANVCTPSRISDLDPRLGDNDHPVAGVTWGQARR